VPFQKKKEGTGSGTTNLFFDERKRASKTKPKKKKGGKKKKKIRAKKIPPFKRERGQVGAKNLCEWRGVKKKGG